MNVIVLWVCNRTYRIYVLLTYVFMSAYVCIYKGDLLEWLIGCDLASPIERTMGKSNKPVFVQPMRLVGSKNTHCSTFSCNCLYAILCW